MSVLMVFLVASGMGQGETNNWYFGNYAGLDFNSGSPVPAIFGAMKGSEGNATISDATGKLLFYTDGIIVWNKNHVPMENGDSLMGDPSTSQSATIVQDPGNKNAYYLFTLDNNAGPNGLRYSVIDITLQGGLGEITSEKNIALLDSTTEQLVAVRHCNGKDAWIIVHEWNSDVYYTYLLTENGVSSTVVKNQLGPIVYNKYGFAWGYMKASADGKKIAMPYANQKYLQLYDFDNSTGMLSNPITLTGTYLGQPVSSYGNEFSPDGTKLYGGASGGVLFQWDISSNIEADINNSFQIITKSFSMSTGALQMGPDNKIYWSRHGANFLGVINQPDSMGAACSYVDDGASLGQASGSSGLPNFIQGTNLVQKQNSIASTSICNGRVHDFFISDTINVDSVIWNFGDPNSGTENTATDFIPGHRFSKTGSYTVTAIVIGKCATDTLTAMVSTKPLPGIIINDHDVCKGGEGKFGVTDLTGVDSVLWNFGDVMSGPLNNSILPSTTHVYDSIGRHDVYVLLFSSCVIDTLFDNIFVVPPPKIKLMDDTAICKTGSSIVLDAGVFGVWFLWSTGDTSKEISVTMPGEYWLEVSSIADGCESSDTMVITQITALKDSMEIPNVFTPNNDGYNDYFIIPGNPNIQSFEAVIYNRWGTEVYNSTSNDGSWNGKFKNIDVPEGVYYWIANMQSVCNDEVIPETTGTVTLLRK